MKLATLIFSDGVASVSLEVSHSSREMHGRLWTVWMVNVWGVACQYRLAGIALWGQCAIKISA
jgi:hypothetical protein